jgi:sortase (surface protein transpeptidase)
MLAALTLLVLSVALTVVSLAQTTSANNELKSAAREFIQNHAAQLRGEGVLGVITIDALKKEYPILAYNENTYQLSVCYYAGPQLNQPGNVTLSGSRAKSGLLFGSLGKLKPGDRVKITDDSGETLEYRLLDSFVTDQGDRDMLIYSFSADSNIRELTLIADSTNGKRMVFKFVEANR